MHRDPTRDEMIAFFEPVLRAPTEFSHDEMEEAIYAFACDWHTGQWSLLYEALCASPFCPGGSYTGISEDSNASVLYDMLVDEYT